MILEFPVTLRMQRRLERAYRETVRQKSTVYYDTTRNDVYRQPYSPNELYSEGEI